MIPSIDLLASADPAPGIVSREALAFVANLQREFGPRRSSVLEARRQRQFDFDRGHLPVFITGPSDDWTIGPLPVELDDRRVEITGPSDRKMMINALNSGARVFMADFEDATSPTWENVISGQANVMDAYEGTLRLETPDKIYHLESDPARLFIRPRGWHLPEKHLLIDGTPCSGSLFDFGLYLFHGARTALNKGTGPYLYLPKLEDAEEALLWNDVFVYAQGALGIPSGTIKATVLIETFPAAFQMDRILFELREHSAGLNAGRWDYIFSTIKVLRNQPGFVLPDRGQISMTVPFMRAYSELLVATCHRRHAPAIGGMAAFIPNRRDPEVTARALAKVTEDKDREAGQGFDGTWVAHPDLVPVAAACFDRVLKGAPNQKQVLRPDVNVNEADLSNFTIDGAGITEEGLRINLRAGIYYLAAWLEGTGAVAIDNMMEDAATAEISRSQVWQWVRSGARLDDGRLVEGSLVRTLAEEERALIPLSTDLAWKVFQEVSLNDEFIDFLTLPAYQLLD